MNDVLTQPFYTVAEIIEKTGLSQAFVYKSVSTGEIPSRKLGGKILIPAEWLKEMSAIPEEGV